LIGPAMTRAEASSDKRHPKYEELIDQKPPRISSGINCASGSQRPKNAAQRLKRKSKASRAASFDVSSKRRPAECRRPEDHDDTIPNPSERIDDNRNVQMPRAGEKLSSKA
jgi:hypothetical protein